MELFPAQPDLSLRISPPNAKPSSSPWTTPQAQEHHHHHHHHREVMDLSFWKRALEPRNSMAKTDSSAINAASSSFELSLSNPWPHSTLSSEHINGNSNGGNNFVQYQQQQQVGLGSEIGFLRPIRGIPVYCQNPPSPSSSSSQSHHHHRHHQALMRSRFMPARFPARRSMRAPRMRWTTTLHARFVNAVELLGGHESIYIHTHI